MESTLSNMLKAAAGANGDGGSYFAGVTYLQHKDTKFRIALIFLHQQIDFFFRGCYIFAAPAGDYF